METTTNPDPAHAEMPEQDGPTLYLLGLFRAALAGVDVGLGLAVLLQVVQEVAYEMPPKGRETLAETMRLIGSYIEKEMPAREIPPVH